MQNPTPYKPKNKVRIVTAASLFDGHDAAINIMRRIMQRSGAEIIHLGHNRSVDEVVTAAIQEDAHAIAVSSYQGGHVEYFKYLVERLRDHGRGDILVFGGGGGVIVPEEIAELEAAGVSKIYSPTDGQKMGLPGMIEDMIARCDLGRTERHAVDLEAVASGNRIELARLMSALELDVCPELVVARLRERASQTARPPVVGITGTGGAGKSSLTDELVRRFRFDQ